MPDRNKEFLAKLLETFKTEAREHLDAISARLGELEGADAPARARAVEVAFREAHSLKAAARAVSQKEIESLCRALEGAFAALKRGALEPSRALLEALQRGADAADDLLAAVDRGLDTAQAARAADLAGTLDAMAKGGVPAPAPAPASEAGAAPAAPSLPEASADTIRLSARRLDALMLQAEDMLAVKLAARRHVAALDEALAALADWRLARDEQPMSRLAAVLSAASRKAASEAREVALKVDRLLANVKQILMLECRAVLDPFARVVRDLAREQGKEIELKLEGGELEIDRRILDELKEPLLHLLRNCVDHGIEKPAARRAAGKPERAAIRIAVTQHEGDKVEFLVEDDGAGVPLKRLAASALKLGLLPPERAASAGEAELLPLIFQSGVSTAPIITDVSGRGLGMAIVREKIERFGGTIGIESRENRGTRFRLLVPHTLATFRGIPVRVANQTVVLPTLGVERVLRRRRANVRTVEDRAVLALNGAHLPFVRLADVLELAPARDARPVGEEFRAVVLGTSALRVAFEVDEVHGDQEVLVKPLGSTLERVRNVLGATVLADGRISPVLNVHDLLKSALRAAHTPVSAPGAPGEPQPGVPRRLLVAEDSITARGLLKNILEAAGYVVKTAVDGVEAWALLRVEPFDAVVSDVEMPRMNGFDLTARIRADRRLAELPVVLVTALESREDRERGVDVGASAYIAKSDFDQQRLLEVLRRLA